MTVSDPGGSPIRDALPPKIAAQSRVYAKDLDREIRDMVWRLFRDAVEPLRESGKLGAILLQFAPWILPAKNTPAMLERAREGLRDLPIAVEFRHPSWLAPRLRERFHCEPSDRLLRWRPDWLRTV